MVRGFTLLEVMIAMLIVIIGIGGVFALITRTTASSSVISNQLIASYLAQEGIEIVRNIRDSNFLEIHDGSAIFWTIGLTGCASGCERDYNDSSFSSFGTGNVLQIDGITSLYNYGSGVDSIFKREITIDTTVADKLTVTVDVSWSEKGDSHTRTAVTELYNWL